MDLEGLKRYFDRMPIAFTVIEIVLGENGEPIDFVFRYANQALAQLEEVNLDDLIGRRFYGDVFEDRHDRKWLKYYYSAAFLNQTHELREFSPEVGKYLKIICYPWLEVGYCACVLFDETALVQAEQRLEYLANYDKTTQFNNRNAYMEFLDQFQSARNIGVVFVDINGLKTLNDRYGHDAGDFLFRMVRDRINFVFGDKTAKIFRIGGDEFVIVLLNVTRKCCQKRAEELREQMKNTEISYLPSSLAAVGWSWAAHTNSLDDLVQQADSSMYQEKRGFHSGCSH